MFAHMPEQFVAEPRVHLGNVLEVDVNAQDDFNVTDLSEEGSGRGGASTATRKLSKPMLTLQADLTEEYEYEVLVFDESRNRQLVAAVEIASPGNKDRPSSRRAFISKCAALLQERVCVSIVDLVTNRNFNLYADSLELIDRKDPGYTRKPPATHAVTLRGRKW